MNGMHDLGGMMGFGPVVAEANEPVFHAEWERRLFGLMAAAGDVGGWSIDEDRQACESMRPADFLNSSYYEHWLHGLEILLVQHGFLTAEELASGRAKAARKNVRPATAAGEVWSRVIEPGSYLRPAGTPARFKPGEKVRARNIHPEGHTRLPRYVRDRIGEVVGLHGNHVFPDSSARGLGEDPRWLYAVRFGARELWGHETDDSVTLDLWEPYLEPA